MDNKQRKKIIKNKILLLESSLSSLEKSGDESGYDSTEQEIIKQKNKLALLETGE
jgi:hypothetical protein